MSVPFIPGKSVQVPEIQYKENIKLPTRSTAMIVVDMQNDFVKPEGNLVVPTAAETIPHIQRLLQVVRHEDIPVAYTQDTTYADDLEFAIWPEHCLLNTWGWEIIPELKPEPDDLVCPKSRYDGFYGTWLEHFLSYVWKVKHLIIVGTVSNICVLHTAASAGLRWFHVVMPANGISALTEFDQALTLRQVSTLYTGDVVKSTDDILFE
jgi:nicotinamidase-related amidase